MGLIKAIKSAIGTGLQDQWREIVRPEDLSPGVLYTRGVLFRNEQGENTKFTGETITENSVIHVPENTCMIFLDGGKVTAVSAEPGYYHVDESSSKTIFDGELITSAKETIKEVLGRTMYGGVSAQAQRVYYINLQEMRGVKFGTSTPLPYYDEAYGLDLEVRAHGTYSIKVNDPLLFYREVVAKDQNKFTTDDFDQQFQNEFMTALATSISNLSIEGVRISHLPSQSTALTKHMADVLDDSWTETRGIEIASVGLGAITYTESSKEILQERNKGQILADPNVRQGYVQGAMARGFESAGKNEAGAGNTFMGMGMGMGAAGTMFGEISKSNQEQIVREEARREEVKNNNSNNANSEPSWSCTECNTQNTGNFCTNCGNKKPEVKAGGFCTNCGHKFEGELPKFCPNCGTKTQ